MPPLIRVDTSAAGLRRSSTSRRRLSSLELPPIHAQHAQQAIPQADQSPTSPISRLVRSISSKVNPLTIPIKIFSGKQSSESPNPYIELNTRQSQDAKQHIGKTTPIERFRGVVQKVIQMNRMRMLDVGEDPGLDARRMSVYTMYGALTNKCSIDVIDFGPSKAKFNRLKNSNLDTFLNTTERPKYSKVRWINVTGLSWDVMSVLAIKYKLHPLAVENVFAGEDNTHSKADYYWQHLFLRVACSIHRGGEEEPDPLEPTSSPTPPLSRKPSILDLNNPAQSYHKAEDTDATVVSLNDDHRAGPSRPSRSQDPKNSFTIKTLASTSLSGAQLWGGLLEDMPGPWAKVVYPDLRPQTIAPSLIRSTLTAMTPEARAEAANQAVVEELKKGQRVIVDTRNLYIFQLRDNTVISIHPTAHRAFFEPIRRRLMMSDTMLRTSPEPSLLVHALIDLVVDYTFVAVEKYRDQINDFETQLLVNPTSHITRDVHIASGDLKFMTGTLKPLYNLVRALRVNDAHKCAALVEDIDYVRSNEKDIQGFMSARTKAYMADVEDHLLYILASINQFHEISEHLLDYSFRNMRTETASLMRAYTLSLVIFYPAIVVIQYFGMNFVPMDSVDLNSETLFWKVAPVVVFCSSIAFTWPFFEDWYHFIKKKIIRKKVLKHLGS